MSDDMTVILNAIQGLREDVERMEGSIRGNVGKMEESIHEDMGQMEGSIRGDMAKMEGSIRGDMTKMEESIRGDMEKMEESIHGDMEKIEKSIREDMTKMETSLTRKIEDGDNAIRLILENDIVPKINVIAENHLNLYHGLENLRQDVQKYELLPIRMSLLEQEVFKQPKL